MSDAFNQMLAQGPTPIKFADPVNQMAQLMQLKNYQQTGVVNQMAIDKGNRQLADQAAYRNMLAQPGFNSTDPATRAQILGLGRGEDLTAMDASAKTQRDLAKTAYDERAASYKAGAPFNATAQQYLDYFDAGAQDPILGAHWESNEGGIAPMRARLVQVLSTPEGLAHVREAAGGQTQAGRDTHDVAMAKIAEANARAAKAGRPDAPTAADKGSNFQLVQDTNGNWVNVDKRTGLAPSGSPVQGRAPGSPAPLSAVQQQKINRDKLADRGVIDQLNASLRSMEIPIYGADIPAKTDASGKIVPASKTPGLLSKGFDTSGIEGVMGKLPSLPGGKAAQAESYLKSVVNQMKGVGRSLMTSANQGKLGNMAVQEWQIAADQVASIDPVKDPDWKSKLEEVVTRMKYNIKLKENQFSELYPDADPGAATPPPSAEGKPATAQSILDEADAIILRGK